MPWRIDRSRYSSIIKIAETTERVLARDGATDAGTRCHTRAAAVRSRPRSGAGGAIGRESSASVVVKRRRVALAGLRRRDPRRPRRSECARARAHALALAPLSRWRRRSARDLAAESSSTRHGSSSMFARESDAVSPRLGGRAILVCAAGTRSRCVTRRASRDVRPTCADVLVIGGVDSCALARQCVVGQPRPVRLGVAWRHSSSTSSSACANIGGGIGSGDGSNDLDSQQQQQQQLLRGVHPRGPLGSRSRLQRELARGTRRRSVSAAVAATATAAAAAAARTARTR